MRNWINIINEVMTRSAEWEWESNNNIRASATFQIGEVRYQVLIKREKGSEYSFKFLGNDSTTVTGTGSAGLVLATVGEIMVDFIQFWKPKTLYFTASMKEPSRVRLYDRLAARISTYMPTHTVRQEVVGEYKLYIFTTDKKLATPKASKNK